MQTCMFANLQVWIFVDVLWVILPEISVAECRADSQIIVRCSSSHMEYTFLTSYIISHK